MLFEDTKQIYGLVFAALARNYGLMESTSVMVYNADVDPATCSSDIDEVRKERYDVRCLLSFSPFEGEREHNMKSNLSRYQTSFEQVSNFIEWIYVHFDINITWTLRGFSDVHMVLLFFLHARLAVSHQQMIIVSYPYFNTLHHNIYATLLCQTSGPIAH